MGELRITWPPVIEGDFGQERFLTEQPIKLIEEGKYTNRVPYIAGVTKDEVAYRAYDLVANENARQLFNGDVEKYAPLLMGYETNTERSRNLSRAIKKFYLNDQPVDNSTVSGLAEAFSDVVVGFGVNRAVKLVAKNIGKPVYYYQTTYLGSYTDFYLPGSKYTIPYGVVHHDDLIYLFYNSYFAVYDETYPEDAKTVEKLTTLYTNFAKTGNPTPYAREIFNNVSWDTFNLQTQKYLDIGKTLVMKERMFDERYSLYEDLYPVSSYL